VDRSILGPMKFVRSNIVGTAVLLQEALGYWRGLDEAASRDFRWVQVSTDEVFGSLGENGKFDEGSAYDPRSPYAASKAAGDHLVRAWWHTYGFPALITNCSNNHGPFQHPEKLIPTVITHALRGLPIPVYGNGTNTRDWLHVQDHCDALLRVAEAGTPGKTYLIGGGNEWRNLDLVRGICRWLRELLPDEGDFSRLITFVEDRPGHDFRYAVDPTNIRRELGWTPKRDPEAAFRETVRWYVENRNWWG
jgi:dTDP-glucose 4,6-dehydratase